MKRESELEREIKEYCKRTGWFFWKFISPSNKGVPDRILFKKGVVLFFELKRKGELPNKIQRYKIELMLSSGLNVFVIDDFEQAKTILDKVLE